MLDATFMDTDLGHAAGEIAIGIKPGIVVTKKLPGEGFKRPARI